MRFLYQGTALHACGGLLRELLKVTRLLPSIVDADFLAVIAKRGFWRDLKHQKEFFDNLGRDLGIHEAGHTLPINSY